MSVDLEVHIPEMFADLVEDFSTKDVVVEHAPLDCRIGHLVLIDLFTEATSFLYRDKTFVVLGDRVNKLRSDLEGWVHAAGLKTTRRPSGVRFENGTTIFIGSFIDGDIDFGDPPFTKIDRLLLLDAHLFSEGQWVDVKKYVVGETLIASEFGSKDHWTYKYAREDSSRVLHRYDAMTIINTFPDQASVYEDLRTRYSVTEAQRYLELKDTEVRRKLWKMSKWLKHHLPHHFPLPFSKMHIHICARMKRFSLPENRGHSEGYIAPRGGAKTTVVSLGYPVYSTCLELETFGILAADSMSQSIQRVQAVAHELENNESLAKDFPRATGRGAIWNKNHIVTRNGIHIMALGIRKKFRGAKQQQFRPSYICYDDLDDDDIPFSPRKREKNNNWIGSNALNLGVTGHTNHWFVGTAIHQECVVCSLPKRGIRVDTFASIVKWPDRMDLWQKWEDIYIDLSCYDVEKRAADALKFYNEHEEDMNKGASVLWPENETLYELMELRVKIGNRAFQAEKQGDPVDPSVCEWDPKCFEGDIFFDEWPDRMDVKTMALDPSKGKADGKGDYQAIALLGIKGSTLYIDCDIARRPIQDMLERFIDLQVDFDPDVSVIEDAVFQELLLYMADDVAVRRKLKANIEPISHEGVRKIVRIGRLGPFVLRKQIRYRRGSQGVPILLDMMKLFPNATHDDGPDAVEMALRKARRMLASRTRTAPRSPY